MRESSKKKSKKYSGKRDIRQSKIDLIRIRIISTTSSTSINELDPSFLYSQLVKEMPLLSMRMMVSKTQLLLMLMNSLKQLE